MTTLARIIHDGSLRSSHCIKKINGSPAWSREGGRRTGDPLHCRMQRVNSTVTD